MKNELVAVTSPSGRDEEGDRDPESLVPDPDVCREFGISSMTLWRWDHDPELIALGWPPPIVIRKRKFRLRRGLNAFKNNLMQRAIARRSEQPIPV